MKVHKLEIIICDPNNEELSIDDFKTNLENSSDTLIHIVKTETKEAPEWNDDSPLNFNPKRADNYFKKL